MAEPRYDLGCRRSLQRKKFGDVEWNYPLGATGLGGLLWAKVSIFFIVLVLSILDPCSSIIPYESMLATSGSLNGTESRRSADRILQNFAFRAFRRPKTGIIYDAIVPTNFSGIKLDAVRLRSGSLRRRGILYNEFDVPEGVVVSPYVERLVLVYQNFMNWSAVYYNWPGFQFVAPILGLLAYDASNLNATNLQELNVVATKNPILIRFSNLSYTRGLTPMCIVFYLNGTVSLSNVSSTNVCSTKTQGHFSLVIRSLAPAPVPIPPPSLQPPAGPISPPTTPPPSPTPIPVSIGPPGKTSNSWKIAVGSSVGGVLAFLLAGFLCFGLLKFRQKSHIEHMELRAEEAEALQTSMVGGSRAPIAGGTRTQPTLETEYTA